MTVGCLGVAVERGHCGHCNHYLLTTLKIHPQVIADETPRSSYSLHSTVVVLIFGAHRVLSLKTTLTMPPR
jgi:hypothetical protein